MDKSDSHFDDLTQTIPVDEHVEDVKQIARLLLDFHAKREETYQMSFAKRGQIGVFMNLARKYDRLDKLAAEYFQYNVQTSVILVDALADLAIYAMKWLAIMARLESQLNTDMGFTQWLEETVSKELGMPVDMLLDWIRLEDISSTEHVMVGDKIRVGGRWMDADEYRNTLQKSGAHDPATGLLRGLNSEDLHLDDDDEIFPPF